MIVCSEKGVFNWRCSKVFAWERVQSGVEKNNQTPVNHSSGVLPRLEKKYDPGERKISALANVRIRECILCTISDKSAPELWGVWVIAFASGWIFCRFIVSNWFCAGKNSQWRNCFFPHSGGWKNILPSLHDRFYRHSNEFSNSQSLKLWNEYFRAARSVEFYRSYRCRIIFDHNRNGLRINNEGRSGASNRVVPFAQVIEINI